MKCNFRFEFRYKKAEERLQPFQNVDSPPKMLNVRAFRATQLRPGYTQLKRYDNKVSPANEFIP